MPLVPAPMPDVLPRDRPFWVRPRGYPQPMRFVFSFPFPRRGLFAFETDDGSVYFSTSLREDQYFLYIQTCPKRKETKS